MRRWRSWFQLCDASSSSLTSCQSHILITNDEDSCFLCHAVGNVTASERCFSARDFYRKHDRLTDHRSRSVTLSCDLGGGAILYPTRPRANGRFVANLVNPLLQCHAP